MVEVPQMNKRAELAWEYIAILILGLIVLLVLILFSSHLKEKIIEGISYFSETILGR